MSMDEALNAAAVLLTEDRFMVEALSASRRGRAWFIRDDGFDDSPIATAEHLHKVELEATVASNMCANNGLQALADACRRIANRIYEAQMNGPDDCRALPDLSKLVTIAVDALDKATDEHAESITRV